MKKKINYTILGANYIISLIFAYYLENTIYNIGVLVLTILLGVIIGIEAYLYVLKKNIKKISKKRQKKLKEELLKVINELNKDNTLEN